MLLDDHFASIVVAVEEVRAVFANIRRFLAYILTSNVPELVPYLAFILFKIPLALTVIQILAVDLGTDMLPALALGAEEPEPGVMEKPPRRRKDRLVDCGLLVLGPIEAVAAMGRLLPGARHRGLGLRTTAGHERPALSRGDHGLLDRHYRGAGRERVPLSQRARVRVHRRPVWKPTDLSRGRNRTNSDLVD